MTRLLPIAALALLAGSAAISGPLDRKSVPPVVHPAPEFHAAGALAALTLLLCGVAVLKGWRRE